MAYRKIEKNKYQVWVEVGYDILGNRQRKYGTVYGTLADVKEKELELTKQYYHKGQKADIKDLTFNEYSKVFLKRYCDENVSLITKKGYERMLKVINKLIGHYQISKINSYILDTMYQKIKTQDGKNLSAETMLHYYRLINVMFVQAVKWDFVNKNPNSKANRPKKQKTERQCYDFQQVDSLIECLKTESLKNRTLVILAIDSGARRGEICDLTWKDIDFERNEINIKSSLKIIDGVIDNKCAKNSYSKRNLYVSDITINLLKQFKNYQKEQWEKENKKFTDNCRIFATTKCEYMYPDTCSKIINELVKKYDLEKITFHGLRHTSASLLINEGIDPKTVSQRLGHSSTNMTMEIYTHSFESSKIESGKKFDKILEKM